MRKYENVAKGLASLGRGGDTMLVHMAPQEVAGLQQLAVASGGSLTINPHTGLPEAGWLSTILPMVAGAAATVMSGGTAAPMMAALYSGLAGAGAGALGAKVEGGDVMTGALGGALGGIGGGGIASGLAGAGASAAGQGAAQAAAQEAASSAAASGLAANSGSSLVQGALSGAGNAAPGAASLMGGASGAASGAPASLAMPAKMAMGDAVSAGLKGLVTPGSGVGVTDTLGRMSSMERMGALGGAMMNMSNSGSPGMKKQQNPLYYATSASVNPDGYVTFGPGKWSKNYNYETLGTYDPESETPYATAPKRYHMADGGAVGGIEPLTNPNVQIPPMATKYGNHMVSPMDPMVGVTSMPQGTIPRNDPRVSTVPMAPGNMPMNPYVAANQEYMNRLNQLVMTPPPTAPAPSSQLPVSNPSTMTSPLISGGNIMRSADMKSGWKYGSKWNPTLPQQAYTFDVGTGSFTKMKKGGLASLDAGRFLQGEGDGVSDSIRASINGRQEARLADGEFVIPARHVSELGNGSSAAGAKRLYDMLHRIEKKRKKTGYAKDSKAYKDLPA